MVKAGQRQRDSDPTFDGKWEGVTKILGHLRFGDRPPANFLFPQNSRFLSKGQ